MELEELNELCNKIIHFYNYELEGHNYYSADLYWKLYHEQKENLLKVKDLIDEELIEKLDSNYYYSSIYNYCIAYNEEILSNDLILDLLNNKKLLSRYSYFNILMMNKKLNNKIILSILNHINIVDDFVGYIPFDYRYHILKRKEINDEIKKKLLTTYEEKDLEYTVEQIDYDLLDEFQSNKILDIDDLKLYDNIYREYLVYDMLRNYLDKEIYKNKKQYIYKIGDITKINE